MNDQEKFNLWNTSSSTYLKMVIEDNYRKIYRLKRENSMAKNILINRGEDINDMREYAETPDIPWEDQDAKTEKRKLHPPINRFIGQYEILTLM